MQYNSTEFDTGAQLDAFLANVRTKMDQIGGGDHNITKEQIEQVLIGNIISHSHDTKYNTSINTDTWDGISVSTLLQGEGTQEDPYLIQSCSDFVHFIKNPTLYSKQDSDNSKYIKFTKNLDFDNHEINMNGFFDFNIEDSSSVTFVGIHVDGNSMVLSKLNLKNAYSVFPQSIYSVFHDIHIRDVNFYINGSSFNEYSFEKTLSLIKGIGEMGAAYNVSITGVLNINGDINPSSANNAATFYTEAHMDGGQESISSSSFSSVDVRFSNTTKNSNMVALVLSTIPGSTTYCTSMPTYDGSTEQGNTFACMLFPNVTCYADLNKTTLMPAEDGVSAVNKTWDEMKGDSFVDLLNSHQNIFEKDYQNKNNGFPVFKQQGGVVIEYEGYVKEGKLNQKIEELKNSIDNKELNNAISNILVFYDENNTNGNLEVSVNSSSIPGIGLLLSVKGIHRIDGSKLPSNSQGLPYKECYIHAQQEGFILKAYMLHPDVSPGIFDMHIGLAVIKNGNNILISGQTSDGVIGFGSGISILSGDRSVIFAKKDGRENYFLNEKGQYVQLLTATSLMMSETNTDVLNSLQQLPVKSNKIKVVLHDSGNISFATIPEEMSEYTIYVKNGSGSDIVQPTKADGSWKCKVDNITIHPSEVIVLHVKYAFGLYFVSVELFN